MSENRGNTFRSLKHFNARLFFFSLLVSNIGSWLQLTASSLLLYRLTGSAADLGYNVAFQFLPMLFFGSWIDLMYTVGGSSAGLSTISTEPSVLVT